MTKKRARPKRRTDPRELLQLINTLDETLNPKAAPPEPPAPTRLYHNVTRPMKGQANAWQKSNDRNYLYMTSDSELQRQKQVQRSRKRQRDAES